MVAVEPIFLVPGDSLSAGTERAVACVSMSDEDRPEPLAGDSDRAASVLTLRDATVAGKLTPTAT